MRRFLRLTLMEPVLISAALRTVSLAQADVENT